MEEHGLGLELSEEVTELLETASDCDDAVVMGLEVELLPRRHRVL
jgi:hypothetical protein